jgi:hypothetical protein
MTSALPIRIVLIDPPAGVTFGVQRGKGSNYAVEQAHTPKRGDVIFDVDIAVSVTDDGPNFLGDYVQGPKGRRFIYVDVGQYAGQKDTPWARRMIIRLDDVTAEMVKSALRPGHRLAARIQGTGGDGGPSCATVQPIGGWKVIKDV